MADKNIIKGFFNDIALSYDKLNHILSFNIDKAWRKKAIRKIDTDNRKYLLDIACGTGDMSILAYRKGFKRIKGIDISENMLQVAEKKIDKMGLSSFIDFEVEDAEDMPYEAHTFSSISIAFGIRNFANPQKGLDEMFRVLKPGGQICILEFSIPKNIIIRKLYEFYSFKILPTIGGIISKNKEAYEYLPDSVSKFPHGETFLAMMKKSGFTALEAKKLTFGISSLYTGRKD